MTTFAIGDVHGRLDLLERAFDKIDRLSAGKPEKIIMLGDYIDRGPCSAGVVAFLREYAGPHELVCLKGNHEDLMVQAMDGDGGMVDCWMMNGGTQTLFSYPDQVPSKADQAWMRKLPFVHEDAHRVYVHAGLMPGREIAEQQEEWCLWIRDRFLEVPNVWGKHVVHGHTHSHHDKPDPSKPELLEGRTNLDTAAYHTGILTMAMFEDALPGGPVSVFAITEPA